MLAERFPLVRLLLIDSGSFDHVALPNWRPGTLKSVPSGPSSLAQVATGASVQQLESTQVCLRLQGGVLMQATFLIMPIVRPILSVGRLRDHDWDVLLTKTPCIVQGSVLLPLLVHRNLFFLPVQFVDDPVWPGTFQLYLQSARHQAQQMLGRPLMSVTTNRDVHPRHLLIEWACSPDSLLSAWMRGRHQEAWRLCLPSCDLTRDEAVHRILQLAQERLQSGQQVFIWASLPFRSWCRS